MFIPIALLTSFLNSAGQDSTDLDHQTRSFTVAIAAIIGSPTAPMQRAIRNNMFNKGFGLTISYLRSIGTLDGSRNTPFSFGGDLGYTYYGRFKQDGIKASYGIAHLHALLRLQTPSPRRFNPYLDLLGGGNFYLSEIKQDQDFATSAIYDPAIFGGEYSAAWVKGAAIGFLSGDPRKTMFYFRFQYTSGGRIRYIVRNSISTGGGAIYYSTGMAPIEYFSVHIGFSTFTLK